MEGSVIRAHTSASNETNKEMLKVRITSNTASNEQKGIRKEIAKFLEEKKKGFTIKVKLGLSLLYHLTSRPTAFRAFRRTHRGIWVWKTSANKKQTNLKLITQDRYYLNDGYKWLKGKTINFSVK